jgi:hypothetical protein
MTPATKAVAADVDPVAEVNLPVQVRDVPAVTGMTDKTGGDTPGSTARGDTPGPTAGGDALRATAGGDTLRSTAVVRTRIGSARDDRRQADNGRADESEECSRFEHSQRPLARGEPSEGFVGEPEPQVQAIDFRHIFVHLTFIDRATVWQDGISRRIAIVAATS